MVWLLLGLVLFLGVHSVRIVAEGWRARQIAQRGEQAWKGAYSLLSAVGLALIVWGYSLARQQPVVLWQPLPAGVRHLSSLLTLAAFVLMAAAYVPGNGLKALFRHPIILGVKAWALAHLLANHTLADALLFGGFLVWAVLGYRAARRRDAAGSPQPMAGRAFSTVLVLVGGGLAWAVFAFWLHGAWIGVRPFG